MVNAGIEYSSPTVILLKESGLGVAEIAARTCYDSFGASENECISEFNELCNIEDPNDFILNQTLNKVNNIDNSDLLSSLAWVHHHHSIIEHATLSFLIKGTSRGVLQEHARHRIQAISVRSTRYTMSGVINAFVASLAVAAESDALRSEYSEQWFIDEVNKLNLFVTTDPFYNNLEIKSMFNKLTYQLQKIGMEEFLEKTVVKSSKAAFKMSQTADEAFKVLQNGKKKRNVGDAFKHIVTDNWKADMVVTFNIRSLKNYFDLRDSGAAYFQIRELAQQMKLATPTKYLKLIDKEFK